MPTDPREERLARRIADLYATDEQFASAGPIEALTAAIEQPGLRLARIVRTVVGAYVPFRGAGSENRPGQRHPTRHGADDREVHQ